MPRKNHGISATAAASVAVGMVVGAGLFKSPALVAFHVPGDAALFFAWLLGGALSVLGALCYSELAAAFPSKGGDYHFLTRAYGARLAFLFAWSRFAVINTGSMALLGFVLGDYLHQLVPAGPFGPALYAIGVIVTLTGLNLSGRRSGVDAQLVMTGFLTITVLSFGLVGAMVHWQDLPTLDTTARPDAARSFGAAMVFVMLAYGGWTEVATLSTEVRDQRRGMLRALCGAMVVVTGLYLVINWALWRGLGLAGLAAAEAPAALLVGRVLGPWAQVAVTAVVAVAVITSINATILAGSRTTFAAARDWRGLDRLARWQSAREVPVPAIVAQSAVAIVLVGFGAWTRGGFATLVDYTAPVFWLFVTLSGVAVIVLRHREPETPRPFRVPAYPVTPVLFIATSLYVLYSSLAYVRLGAIVSIAVLGAGFLLSLCLRSRSPDLIR